jgi:hypothetical protein
MYIKKTKGPRSVRLPDGTLMSLADLPPVDTRRWVASRKAAVVRAVAHGLIDTQEALKAYHLSEEEFLSWVRAIADHGEDALKTTSTQKYRQP